MSNSKYLKDESINQSYYDEGIISPSSLIVGSALMAGSALAFKKGLLKPLVKEAIELSGETKPLLSVGFNDMRRWIKSNEGVSENSLFRKTIKNLASDVLSQDKELAKEIVTATKEDFGMFKKMFNTTLDELNQNQSHVDIINNYANTGILNEAKRGSIEVRKYSDKNMHSRATMQSKVYDTVLENFTRTDKQLQEQLQNTGFRPVTIEDMFETTTLSNGRMKLKTKVDRFDFDNISDKTDRLTPKNMIEELLNQPIMNTDGEILQTGKGMARLKDKHNLKNLILDKDLLIDETGKIIDLRGRRRSFYEAVENFSSEWKIPFININPLGMVGLNKINNRKVNFGTITEDMVAPVLTGKHGNTVENTIKNVKRFDDRLKDVKEGVTIINGDVYTLGENGSIKKLDYKTKKSLTLVKKEKAHNSGSLTFRENAQRKMMGISDRRFIDYTEADGSDKYIKQRIAKAFDIGRQEKDITKDKMDSLIEAASPDSYVENLLSKIGLKMKPYKDVEVRRNFTEMMKPGQKLGTEDTLFVTNQTIGLKDIVANNFNEDAVKGFFKQFVADFKKDSEYVNNNTGYLHFVSERMNQAISAVGLGTSMEAHSGPLSSMASLVTKRFLPVYGVYQGWNFLNMVTEGEDEKGQRTNLNRTIMEGVASLDVGVSHIRDKLGITSVAKRAVQLMPGYDQIEELPGINSLNLHQSAEERQDYWEYGKDPVRKARYWALNSSTSFTGGKINYYKLNPLQAAKADATFSDSQFGSRKEYFANMLNPYHYDKKHYNDRPYLMTSPAFENVPIIGNILSSTVGKIVKPQIKMHNEYWNGDDVKTSDQIKGDQVIADIEQQRMVSSGVSNVMMAKAGQTVQQAYMESNVNSMSFYISLAKEKAKEMVSSAKAKIKAVTNTFEEVANKQDEDTSKPKITTEKAMLEVTDPSTNLSEIRKRRGRPDDSAYYKETENSTNDLPEGIFKSVAHRMPGPHKEIIDEAVNNIYYNSPMAYQPKKDYSGQPQLTLPSEEVPAAQTLGSTILMPGVSPNEPIRGKSGVNLGDVKDYDGMLRFDKTFDLSNQNMVYRTGSGKMNLVNTGEEVDPLVAVNTKKESPDSFIGGGKKGVSVTGGYIVNKEDLTRLKESNIENPNSLTSSIKNQITNSANVAGIYGFAFNSATGEMQKGRTIIDTPGWSRSFNRMFWEKELGGFGGDISEIFRRLVQKRTTAGVNYYDPIRNTMPEWLPGEGSFIDFQHGDPYTKIARGEERLPGEGFERAYGINIDDYELGSSFLGKSKEELIQKFLQRSDITDEEQQSILRKGTRMHERIEKYMLENHVAIDSEVKVKDYKNNVMGYYDVRIHDRTAESGQAIIDIKTISDKGFQEVLDTGLPKEEHVKQVNFYLHNTNKKNNGGILYVNREDPTQMKMIKFKYSKDMYNETMDKVNSARNEVRNAINSGQISRAERYRPIDKLRILADVAPYSQEYSDMLKYVRSMDLSESQKKEVTNLENMVTEQRKQLRTYDYRFKTADVIKKTAKITRQIDDDKFMTDSMDDPIKLAGVILPSKTKDEEKYKKAMEFLRKNVKGKVKIKIAKDELKRNNKDSLNSVGAVVYANGMNINRELIKRNLADEKENDYSAAGVHARFNSLQRNFGSAWETIAHQDTILNDKILRVRSAKEDYERQQVYGKDFKSWTSPIKDFLVPMMWKATADENTSSRVVGALIGGATGAFFGGASKNKYGRLIGAGVGLAAGGTTGTSLMMGAFTGSLFGKSRFGKLLGASVGASFVVGAKAYKIGYEAKTGEKWIPKEKRRENEVIEYLDKLEFVKNRRLFEVYSQKALKEDGIDVKTLIKQSEEKADSSKSWARKIEKIKREQKKSGKFDAREYEKAGLKFDKNDKKHYLLRKDEANEKEKESIRKRKETIKKEDEKLIEAKKELKKAKLEYRENHNFNEMRELPKELVEVISKQKEKIDKKEKRLKESTKEYIKNSKKRKQTALEKTVNKRINEAKSSKEIMMTSPNAMKAIEYYNKAEQTMYGYDPGEEISNFVAALPKKDKKYFNEFLKAGEKERKEILKIAPKYMRRALQASYKMKVDEKESLVEYFSKHYLPDESWDGWQESYDSDAIKTKVIAREGFNLASHDIWEDNKAKADMYGATPIPNIDNRTKDIQAVKSQLKSVLGEAGYKDLDISVSTGHQSPSINLELYESRKEKFENKIRERVGGM